jgi:hypothetical protein
MRNDVCLGYFVRDVIDFDNARCLSTLQRNRVEHYRKNGREAERDGGRIHTYCLLIAEAAGSWKKRSNQETLQRDLTRVYEPRTTPTACV